MKNIKLLIFLLIVMASLQNALAQGIDKPRYQIETHRAGNFLGTFNIELFPLIAPMAVHYFDSLAGIQFFDSTAFHRVVPGFVIQGGDPNSIHGPISTWGNGQPWQPNVNAEFSAVRHVRGIIGAARDTAINSANSQFYICVANALFLDGQYTVYGKVTQGMDIVDTIVNSPRDLSNDVPLQKIEMFVTFIGVNDTVPDIPQLIFPANNAQGIINGKTFQWSNVDGAVLYTIEISLDSLFSNFIFQGDVGLNSKIVSLLSSGTNYYWRVKSNNGGHESIYSTVYFFTTAYATQLISPTNTSVNVPVNPVMQWTALPNVNSYRLQIATTDSFSTSSLIINQGGITSTSRQVNLLPNTQYYWRVNFISSGGQGFYSSTFSFTTWTTVSIIENGNVDDGVFVSRIFPNPSHELLTIAISVSYPVIAEISLKNIAGQQVFFSSQKLDSKSNSMQIDVSSLKAGSYFLSLKTPYGESMHKIQVE